MGDLDQKLGTMIAGGDYPDIIFAGDAATKLMDAGMLRYIVLNQFEVLVHSMDFRIPGLLQHSLLDIKADAALEGRRHLGHVILEGAINFHIIYMAVRLGQIFRALLNPAQNLLGAGNEGAVFVDQTSFETSFYQVRRTWHSGWDTWESHPPGG